MTLFFLLVCSFLACAYACSAVPACSVNSIFFRVEVAHRAVRFRCARTAVIFCLRNRFEVLGIYAASIPAQMVNVHPFQDGALEQFIDNTVGLFQSAFKFNATVTVTAGRSSPEPTSRERFWGYVFHRALKERTFFYPAAIMANAWLAAESLLWTSIPELERFATCDAVCKLGLSHSISSVDQWLGLRGARNAIAGRFYVTANSRGYLSIWPLPLISEKGALQR